MRRFYCTLLYVFFYILISGIIFGHPLKPIAFMTIYSNRLGVPDWPFIALVGGMVGLLTVYYSYRTRFGKYLIGPISVIVPIAFATIPVGLYAEYLRSEAIEAFEADNEIRHSFFLSLNRTPREFQFYFHGAALKNCVPYLWSYRTMSFHELTPNVGANVLPKDWIDQCQIKRR